MKFAIGDKVVYGDLRPIAALREGVISKVKDGSLPLIWVDGKHRPEDAIISGYAWPIAYADRLREICTETERLQKIVDDRMGLIYQLRNEVSRNG